MIRRERGSAVVDYVLVMMILIPLVLGIVQLGLVLHVRNTLTAAASDAARAGAPLGASPQDARARAVDLVRTTLADRYADDITVSETTVAGAPAVRVRIRAEVPALGLFGPAVPLDVRGHAVKEVEP
ncbi:pilus assembly protein [Aeromicrobium halocynthiae]|uniref:Pilus assembly protein n=1 Tax=Aeromicrobium halocynthiae TaxID=560557 RepID=A0ABP5HER3_9ACTN